MYNTNQKKTNIFEETFVKNSSNNNFPKNFLNKLPERKKEKIPLDVKFPNAKLGFKLPFTKQESIEGSKNRKDTSTGPDRFTHIF